MFEAGHPLVRATNAQISNNGPIRSAYAAAGFENASGYPATGQICGLQECWLLPDVPGRCGPVVERYRGPPSPFGAIRGTYASFGFESGRLGTYLPEHCGTKNGGCYQMYETGRSFGDQDWRLLQPLPGRSAASGAARIRKRLDGLPDEPRDLLVVNHL
jgi:hypothetical protein